MRLSVVVIRYGLREMEDDALRMLVTSTVSREWSLRIVDNWGNPESLVALWNRVAEQEVAGGSDAVCFLNSDCWVGEGWDSECLHAFRDDRVAVVGPQCNMGPQTAPSEVPVPQVISGWPDKVGVNRAARRCRELWTCQFRESEVFGHCYMVTAKALEAVHGLESEIADGYTLYGAEQSLSRRIRAAGFVTGTAMGAYCYHAGEASGKAAQAKGLINVEAEREKGRKLFFGIGSG